MNDDYLIVIETGDNNLSAFSPDLPGCVATGATETELRERMAIAIGMHIEGLVEDGLPVPPASAKSVTVTPVASPADEANER